ncbi:catalase [Actinomadura sp. CNU-125]|uniref:catalase n=1 Tax=Actinomadura sp. CNU-125 TaxID=1904961 RepID=UPI000963F3E2|nr:catalase [Actinomadura sp. CNU-125]OLT17007.1 catalase [Actinomadura sp. CNU-125]
MSERPTTTDDAGIPAASDAHSLSVGPNGPLLMQDHYVIQKMAHFNRERVPERVVHAKGGGAYGVLEITEDVSRFTRAKLFQKGARTESLVRFSSVAGELGSADAGRDPRGFAMKFYTEEGNYDLVGNNTPVFFIRDPQKFSDFIHSQKRRADNHLRDNNMQWDFWTLSPESAHQVSWLMTDRGTPASWRHMNGYGSHTFLWYNAAGEKFWVKYHFKTDQGIKNFTAEEADAQDPDVHIRDLYTAIQRGDHPSWTVQVQIMPFEDAADYRFNPFDLTKVWPHADYPPITIGKWTLNRNPENYFAEIEQAAFEPANLVPGIGASPDKMLQGRLFSYPDAHRYRIGANYLQLPVNRPHSPVRTYNKDGAMAYYNSGDPVYAPNSAGGPEANPDLWAGDGYEVAGEIVRSAYRLHSEDDDFVQPRALWEKVLGEAERDRMVHNILLHANAPEVTGDMKKRVAEYWRNVQKDLGDRVAKGLGVNGS